MAGQTAGKTVKRAKGCCTFCAAAPSRWTIRNIFRFALDILSGIKIFYLASKTPVGVLEAFFTVRINQL
ncbi:MAG: hypothetical protein ACLVDL_12605 [Faecalibacterium prausnitzii]|jgi:hypothetical protein